MFSTLNSLLAFLGAAGFWTLIGLPFARRTLPAPLAVFAAPALGWALHSAVALPVHRLIGFGTPSVIVLSIAALAGSIAIQWRTPRSPLPYSRAHFIGAMLAAVAIALCVAVAIAPKFDHAAVLLSPAMFDHAKVALIDEMARLGVPPGNPFLGGGPFAYYYLWHFSAAELVLATGITGWEADAALTAFSAYSSVLLMMGLSVWLSGRISSAFWIPLLAFAGSLRPVLEFLFGKTALYFVIWPPTGFAGWFFQAAWVPQHIASATCVVLAIVLLAELARKPNVLCLFTFVLTVIAGFESSTWVGGVTFAFAAAMAGLVLLIRIPASDRRPFILWSAAGAVLALAIAAPFLIAQFESSVARGLGSPVALHHYDVLGEFFPAWLRRMLDLPAYWLVFLPVEFPAIYPVGVVAMIVILRSNQTTDEQRHIGLALATLTIASLVVGWLFVSTLANNNDLGWRAVLPAVMVLTACTACGLTRWITGHATLAAAAALSALILGLPDGLFNLRDNTLGRPNRSGAAFAQQSLLWERVRIHAAPDEPVGNNPFAFADMTPWPVNIAWALLSDRRSCYAGSELALAYAPLTGSQRQEIDQQFTQLFDGKGSPDDVRDLAQTHQCRVIVVTPQDGAWASDPFRHSPFYHLIEERPGAWRIYRAVAPSSPRTAATTIR